MLKVRKNTILKWTKALRSGKYKQTFSALQDENGFCCLGVACDIFIPKKEKIINDEGLLAGAFPSDQKVPAWLKDINNDFLKVTEDNDYLLSDINDTGRYSFDEIADLIELVYVHKAFQ